MLFGEIIAVYSENKMKHINTLFGKNTIYFYIKADGTYSTDLKHPFPQWEYDCSSPPRGNCDKFSRGHQNIC
jgi:hypothetical protein